MKKAQLAFWIHERDLGEEPETRPGFDLLKRRHFGFVRFLVPKRLERSHAERIAQWVAMASEQATAEVVLIDVDPLTWNLDSLFDELVGILAFLRAGPQSLFWTRSDPELDLTFVLLHKAQLPSLELIRGDDRPGTDARIIEHFESSVAFDVAAHLRRLPKSSTSAGFDHLVFRDRRSAKVLSLAKCFASDRYPVLLSGEPGTGKESLARAMHLASGLKGDFISINCPSLAPERAEQELFGLELGDGTKGAVPGSFERAESGTLYIAYPSQLPAHVQSRIAELVMGSHYYRVNGASLMAPTFRLVVGESPGQSAGDSASNLPGLIDMLGHEVIELPSLHERPEDLRTLVHLFLSELNAELGANDLPSWMPKTISDDGITWLASRRWRGNIDELKQVLRSCCRRFPTESILFVDHLEQTVTSSSISLRNQAKGESLVLPWVADWEKMEDLFWQGLIKKALESSGRYQQDAARSIGMPPGTFSKKREKYCPDESPASRRATRRP